MPTYEYLCEKCDRKFERRVRSSSTRISCPGCKSGKVRRLFSVFGLNLGSSPEKPFTGL